MVYAFYFVDGTRCRYNTIFTLRELLAFVQQAQTLKLTNDISELEECVNLKYVMRIEELK